MALRFARFAAAAAVLAMLALLVWKVAFDHAGSSFTGAIRNGTRPAAPAFDLALLTGDVSSWPASLRAR